VAGGKRGEEKSKEEEEEDILKDYRSLASQALRKSASG